MPCCRAPSPRSCARSATPDVLSPFVASYRRLTEAYGEPVVLEWLRKAPPIIRTEDEVSTPRCSVSTPCCFAGTSHCFAGTPLPVMSFELVDPPWPCLRLCMHTTPFTLCMHTVLYIEYAYNPLQSVPLQSQRCCRAAQHMQGRLGPGSTTPPNQPVAPAVPAVCVAAGPWPPGTAAGVPRPVSQPVRRAGADTALPAGAAGQQGCAGDAHGAPVQDAQEKPGH